MPDDLDTDSSVPPITQPEAIERLAEQVRSSYAQTGASNEAISLVREYVDAVVRAGYQSQLDNLPYLDELVLATLNLGVSDQQITDAVASRLNDLATGKGCASTSPSQQLVHHGGEPVEMFTGQFTHEATDVMIKGAGLDFTFRRCYKNQAVYLGTLGSNWDHSYNLYIRQVGTNLVWSSGELREDTYTRHPLFGQAGFDYWVPPDGRHGIIEENGASFAWRTPSGVRYLYQQDPADGLFHRIHRIQDRFGNYLGFAYQNDKLQRVEINNPTRFVIFTYDTLDRISYLQEHTGRQWTYSYDDYDDLVSVTTPATDRYLQGLTTTYEYSSSQYSAPLQHNLLSIIDPAGQLYLENEYGTNLGLLNFKRVVRQSQGGGEFLFEYETVVSEFEYEYDESEKPAIQVNHILRNGQITHLVYNTFGNLLLREEYIQQEGRRRLVQWRHRFNRDGSLIGTITPEGNVTQYHYGRDDYLLVYNIKDEDVATHNSLTASERLAFGNLLAIVRRGTRYTLEQMNLSRGVWGNFFPDVLAALDPADIVVKNTYESDYQQILSASDPRYTARADPRFAEAAAYAEHLIRYEYTPMPEKLLRRIRQPDTTFPSPLPDGTLGLNGITDEYLQYDAKGRPERVQDPEGYVTENRYNQGAAGGLKEGYLREIVRDANTLSLATMYEVNDVGIITQVTNPRNVPTQFVVNKLDQTIRTISGGPGFITDSFFDRNGLLERQERDNLDDAGQRDPQGNEVKTYQYDDQNNLVRGTTGGADLTKHHVTRHLYDCSDKRIETILPEGNRLRFTYDERLLQTTVVRGATSALASTVRTRYDGDGRKSAVVDGRGNITHFEYDVFNRVSRITDALGNIQQSVYDKQGNVTISRFFERRADGSYQLLKRQEFQYDERGSRVVELNFLFLNPIPTANLVQAPDAEFDTARNQGAVTAVKTQYFFDKNQRLFRMTNDQGQVTSDRYDGLNRRVRETDDVGNYTETFYDENSNVIRVDQHELVRDPQNGNVIRQDVFSTVHDYDALDRRISSTDGLGNRTTFTYDSRNQLVSITDPLGNIKRSVYDVFGQKRQEITQLTETGLGGGMRLADILSRFDYDDNNRLTKLIDANNTATDFVYDDLDRLILTIYADGSNTRVEYDPNDNMIGKTDNNGLHVRYDVDPLNRITRVALDKTGLNPAFPYPPGAEEFESYEYDGLGRVRLQQNDSCEIRLAIDSLGRAYDEQVRFTTSYPAPVAWLGLSRTFDTLANRTDLVYPTGRAIHYDYDSLNRMVRITNRNKGANYLGSATFPAQHAIANYQYRGLRLARVDFGNKSGYEHAFDGARRLISTRHFSGANLLLEIQQLYDGVGNRRFQLDNPAGAAPINGETYSYDSMYRLTKFERKPIALINPLQFEPPNTPLPVFQMTGQQGINDAIGALAQDPLAYVYKYDPLGNRVEERAPNQPAVAYVPNALNQYQSVNAVTFRYDLNGNLLDDGARLYRYNYRNQLSVVLDRLTNAELLRMRYDAIGRLVAMRDVANALHFINDGSNVIEEYMGGNLSSQYVCENGMDWRCQLAAAGAEWWYHADLIRSTRLLSNANGQVPATAQFKYDPFGATIAPIVSGNPCLFTGKRLLGAAGLYDSRTRHYSPALGRFLQRDARGTVDGPNLYVYSGNNPATFVDPFGWEKSNAVSLTLGDLEQAGIDFQKPLTLQERFALVTEQYNEALEGASGAAIQKIHEYYQSQLRLLRREAINQGNIEGAKFAVGYYAASIAAAIGGAAGSTVGFAVAGEFGLASTATSTYALAGGLSGLTAASASELTYTALGKPNVSEEALLLGGGLGVAGGLLAAGYSSFNARGLPPLPFRTPGGRPITYHAGERMVEGYWGRRPVTPAEVDILVETGTFRQAVIEPSQGWRASVQLIRKDLRGKPYVAVSLEEERIITTMVPVKTPPITK